MIAIALALVRGWTWLYTRGLDIGPRAKPQRLLLLLQHEISQHQ